MLSFSEEMSLYPFCLRLLSEIPGIRTYFSLPSAHFLRVGLVLPIRLAWVVGKLCGMKVNSVEGYPSCGSMPGCDEFMLATGQ